jgi:hypothetical protein
MDEIKKLYDALIDNDLYSKTIEDFKVQFEDEDYKKRVFDAVVDSDLFSKDFNTFKSKYSLLDDLSSEDTPVEDEEVDNTSDFLNQYISKDPTTQISKDLSYFDKDWDKEKENVGNVWFGGKGLEESIVPKLNETFNKWGFVFEQDDITGDAVKITSTKNPNISESFNIDNPSEGMKMVKAFIEKNKSDNAVFSENIDELSITDDYVKNLVKATKEKDEEKKNELLTGVSRKIYASKGINYDEIKSLNQKIVDNENEETFIKDNLVTAEFEKIDPRSGGVINYYNVEGYKPTNEEIEKYSNIFNKDGSLKINPKQYLGKLKKENDSILDITAHESVYKAKQLEVKLFNNFKNKETSKILEGSNAIKSKSSSLNEDFIKITGKSIADSESVNLEIDKNVKYFDNQIKEITGGLGLNEISDYKPKTQQEADSINSIIQNYSTYYSNNVKPVIDIYSQYSSLSSEAEQLDDIGNTINTMLNFDDLIKYRGQYEDNAFNSVINNARKGWSQGVVNRDFVNAAYGITDITDEEQMASVSKRIAEQTALQRGILTSEVWERYNNAGSVSEQMRILKTNPTEVLLSLFGNSMSMFASTGARTFFPTVGGATATGAVLGSGAGPGGTLAGGLSGLSKGLLSWQTITAFNMEMGSAFSEELTKNGYDLTDADQVILGLKNKKVTDAAVSRGVKRGVPIAIANFLGGAAASGFVNPLATTGRQVVSQFAKGALIEPIFEGAGEAAAQLAADGELLGTEIFNEMIGGMPGSQSNIAVTFASNQFTNKQANTASKLEDINYISENNFGYNDVRAFTNRLLGKKKITASQAKKIVENARIVDETNSIMRDSPKFVSRKNKNNARVRISDLIQHRNLIQKSLENASGDVKSRLSETLGSIESEINEIASTGKTLAKSDVKTVNDLANLYRRNLSSGLQFINKKLGKENYEAVILNEETKKQLKANNPELYEAISALNVDDNTSGFIMPNIKGKNYIVVNEDNIDNSLNAAIAAGDTSGFSVMSHEILHAVLNSAFEEKEIKDLSIELEKYVLESDDSKISAESKKRIKTRLLGYEKEYGGKDKRYYEEVFTTLSDEMQDENIDYNRQDKSFWLKIADTINDYIYKNKSSFDEVTRGSLKIKTAEEAFNFIKDYNKVFNKDIKVSKDKIKTKTPIIEEGEDKSVFSKQIDLTKKSNQDILNNLVGDKDADGFYTTTKEEFTNSQAENAAKLLLQTGSFDNLIGKKILVTDPKQRQEILEKSKDNIEKHISAFDPTKNKNLFGYINSYIQNKVGTAAKTVLKQPKTVPTSKKIGGEDSKVTVAETLVSDEISPEEYADMQLAKEKLEKIEPQQSAIANKIGLTENEINIAKREIINFLRKTDRPAMTDPKKFFKALIDYTTGKGVQPGGFAKVIYDKLSLPKNGELSTKNRESFIGKIAEDLIALNKVDPAVMRRSNWKGLFYDVEIENMSPTQTQKAIDEGRVPSTTNLNAGNDLFKTLNPSDDQVVNYLMKIRPDVFKRKMPKFLAEVIVKNEFNDIVDNTTQPVYDTKGNITDNTIDLSETITEEEVTRGAPQVREKIARPEGVKFSKTLQNKVKKVIAESAKTKIAKEKQGINADIEKAYGGSLDHSNPDDFEKLNSNILNVFAPEFGVDIFSYTTSQTLAAAGNNAFGSKPSSGAIGAKFWYVNDLRKVTDVEKLGETTSMIEAGYIGDLTELNNTIAKKLNLKIPTPKNRIYIAKSQGLSNLEYNKKNIDTINKEKENTLDKWKKIYDKYPNARPSIKELQYNNNANAAVSKNEAIVLDSMDGASESNKYEEHGYQHGEYSLDKAKAMSSKVEGVWKNWKDYAEKEYKQMVFNKTTRIKSIKGDMRTYQGIVDLTYNLPEYGEWKAKSEKYPLVSEMMNIAMKTGKKSDWNRVPPASDMRFFNEIIKLNPFTLKTFYNGKTVSFAEKYGLEVPKKFQNDPNVYELVSDLIFEINKTKAGKLSGDLAMTSVKAQNILNNHLKLAPEISKSKTVNVKNLSNDVVSFSKTNTNQDVIGYAKTVDEALAIARDPNAPVKKIRVFDFDDTLATTKSDVLFTAPDGTEGKLNAEEFAKKGSKLLEEGYVFDFSEFNKVTDGKPGPLLDIAKKIQEARGTEDVFVLTARAPEAQVAIKEFLDSVGLNIPLENITGLGNSTGAAKANWIVDKAAEGYNDFYFADDAYQNVKAVQDALSQLDVKSKVQQAKVRFSKTVNEDFNKIIEQKTGIASEKRYSRAKAKVRGAGKGNKKFFIPYSAEDFMGLIYPLLSKGSLGDSQMAWFKEHLLDPYARAMENVSRSRINLLQDFKALKKGLQVPKDLRKINKSGFTNEQAVRVYLFNKTGNTVPGLSKTDMQELLDTVNSDGLLKAFADQILNLTKGDGYSKPGQSWLAGTITTDLIDVLNTVKRAKYLDQSGFTKNAELIFSEENLNKLEAAYGEKYRDAMENILKRMKSGKNRLFSGNRLSNRVLDYINGSIGAIMFFNTRSAVLQTISNINFLNWSFNNPIKAGKAFANQPQYWKDFMELMNSDYLVDRRNGLKININENEIADAAATSKNKAKAVMSYILQKGFLPTQFADSFAIASGGATFYRNRINDLIKNEGLTEAEAKKKAMLEFRQVAETSQQSSDPSKISAQQASDLGRVVLAFNNTPMQYARLQKRAIQDLVNGRGDAKTNVSRIIYYGVVQNLIFNVLQQALFALGAGDDEDEMSNEEKEKYEKTKQKKYMNIANGMLDSLLRGLGVAGLSVSVVKNFLMDVYERSGRKRPEYVDAVYKLLQISPPISSKISKVRQAAYQFDSKKRREEIFEKGFSIDNPAYEAASKVISATTNLPLDRLYNKANNIEAALAEDTEAWQTIAMLAGWPEWQINPGKTKKEKENWIKNDGWKKDAGWKK